MDSEEIEQHLNELKALASDYEIRDANPRDVNVYFSQDRSWIYMHVAVGDSEVTIRLSDVYDPIPDLIRWMEAILIGVMECAFEIDEEGRSKDIRCILWGKDELNLVIKDVCGGAAYIDVNVFKRQLIDSIYNGLKSFANSDAYMPKSWEIETLEDRLIAASGKDTESTLDDIFQLDSQELKKLLFAVAPSYTVSWPALGDDSSKQWEKFVHYVMDENEKEHELGMKRTPDEWEIDENYDAWELPWRKKYLRKYICVRVNEWEGSKLKEVRSLAIEKFLEEAE